MPALQVKNLPEDLHARLAIRAASEGVTMAEYVTRLLRRDLERPTIEEWMAAHPAAEQSRRIDISAAIDDVRVEYADDHAGTAAQRRTPA